MSSTLIDRKSIPPISFYETEAHLLVTNLIWKVSPGKPGSGRYTQAQKRKGWLKMANYFLDLKKKNPKYFAQHNWKLESKQLSEVLLLFAHRNYTQPSTHAQSFRAAVCKAFSSTSRASPISMSSTSFSTNPVLSASQVLLEKSCRTSRSLEHWVQRVKQVLLSRTHLWDVVLPILSSENQETLAQSLSWHTKWIGNKG